MPGNYRPNTPIVTGAANPFRLLAIALIATAAAITASCGADEKVSAKPVAASLQSVGVTEIHRQPIEGHLTVSSELVPFQEIDVYAKEAGFVNQLLVDYGTRVTKGQLMAVLEIPELQAQIHQDNASIKSMQDQVTNAQHQLGRVEAQHKVMHLEFERLDKVAQSKPGLVAQQEVDDVQGRDLAAEAQIEGAKSNLETARSNLVATEAKLEHDQAIFSYARITAPFTGVVTQRYANLGTLLQAGTNSSTQAMPLVKLSEEDRFRIVIPVPESYVAAIRIGDSVEVRVPALERSFPGKVARFSADVHDATRTMHTEVDVLNPKGVLIPGMYAEATLRFGGNHNALAVPFSAVDRDNDGARVLIVDEHDKIESRQITLGTESDNEAQALSGLKEGDRVVVSDRTALKPGQLVHPQTTPPPSYDNKS